MTSHQPTGSGPSWGLMLVLLAIAILLAAAIAYRMIYPFFHQHPAHQALVTARVSSRIGMPSSTG
jgi:hypothetical protein